MESLAGHLLVATPALKDPNFERTVVLLVAHEPGGALTTGDGAVAWSSYLSDPSRRVIAVDAQTGELRWTYDYPASERSLDHIMFSDGYLVYGGRTSSD